MTLDRDVDDVETITAAEKNVWTSDDLVFVDEDESLDYEDDSDYDADSDYEDGEE